MKKRMKQLAALSMAALMAASLAACGSSGGHVVVIAASQQEFQDIVGLFGNIHVIKALRIDDAAGIVGVSQGVTHVGGIVVEGDAGVKVALPDRSQGVKEAGIGLVFVPNKAHVAGVQENQLRVPSHHLLRVSVKVRKPLMDRVKSPFSTLDRSGQMGQSSCVSTLRIPFGGLYDFQHR